MLFQIADLHQLLEEQKQLLVSLKQQNEEHQLQKLQVSGSTLTLALIHAFFYSQTHFYQKTYLLKNTFDACPTVCLDVRCSTESTAGRAIRASGLFIFNPAGAAERPTSAAAGSEERGRADTYQSASAR